MKKPQSKSIQVFDLQECIDYICYKHKINVGDYAGSCGDFARWCKQVKEKPISATKLVEHIAQHERYGVDVAAGTFIERPFQDWLPWLLYKANLLSVIHGGFFELKESMGWDAEPWQQKILSLFLKEFGQGPYRTP